MGRIAEALNEIGLEKRLDDKKRSMAPVPLGVDMVLNRLSKGCKEIDIAATLEHIRDQRGGMVQNRQQFEFCLMAVAEEVHAILKALPQQPQQSPPAVSLQQ